MPSKLHIHSDRQERKPILLIPLFIQDKQRLFANLKRMTNRAGLLAAWGQSFSMATETNKQTKPGGVRELAKQKIWEKIIPERETARAKALK